MMLADSYATALHRAIQQGTDAAKACESLVSVLTREGKKALLPSILRAYQRLVFAHKRSGTTITLANTQNEKAARAACMQAFGATDASIHIDETIIGGYAIEHQSKRIDNTYKSALLTMYRSIISN